jgi:PIN domain nuclease of toxin-antitoxin system
LQGLGLKVDLIASDAIVDAEAVLATNIHEEATHPAEVEVPQSAISDVDVTEDAEVDEFMVVGVDDAMPDEALAPVTADADGAQTTDTNEEEEA